MSSLAVAAVLFLVRLAAVWCGCWAGCTLSVSPAEHRQHLWKGMITQVHETLELLLECCVRFDFFSLVFGTNGCGDLTIGTCWNGWCVLKRVCGNKKTEERVENSEYSR